MSVAGTARSPSATRSLVLDAIRSEAVVSRTDLVEITGLSGATITRIIKDLIREGYVIETGQGPSTGGKRPTNLELSTITRYAVGISLDDARLSYALTDVRGNLVGRLTSRGITSSDPADVVEQISSELTLLLEHNDIERSQVIGVGIAVAGRRVEQVARLQDAAALDSDWESFQLHDAVERATGFATVVENDSACAAVEQFWVGNASADSNFATVYMATGIGCGFVIGGTLYRGSTANAGEIGHMVLERSGPLCHCGQRGCLEILAAPKAVVVKAMRDTALSDRLELGGRPQTVRQDFSAIAHDAARGGRKSLALIERSAKLLATAMVSLVNIMDLDRIVFAGPSFVDIGPIYARATQEELERTSFARTRVVVGVSDVGLQSTAVGAAAVVLQRHLTPAQQGR